MKLRLIYEGVSDSKVSLLTSKYNVDGQTVLRAAELDPTPNKKFLDWILRQAHDMDIDIEYTADPDYRQKIFDTLKAFIHISRVANIPKDIMQYKSFDDLATTIVDNWQDDSNRALKKAGRGGQLVLPPGTKVIVNEQNPPGFEGADVVIVSILNDKASQIMCSGTKLCTANAGTFDSYSDNDSKLFMVYVNNERYALLSVTNDGTIIEAMNMDNIPISLEQTLALVRILNGVGVDKISPQMAEVALRKRNEPGYYPELEPSLFADGGYSERPYQPIYVYIKYLNQPSPGLEEYFIKNILKETTGSVDLVDLMACVRKYFSKFKLPQSTRKIDDALLHKLANSLKEEPLSSVKQFFYDVIDLWNNWRTKEYKVPYWEGFDLLIGQFLQPDVPHYVISTLITMADSIFNKLPDVTQTYTYQGIVELLTEWMDTNNAQAVGKLWIRLHSSIFAKPMQEILENIQQWLSANTDLMNDDGRLRVSNLSA